jgi:hypothetical protein
LKAPGWHAQAYLRYDGTFPWLHRGIDGKTWQLDIEEEDRFSRGLERGAI